MNTDLLTRYEAEVHSENNACPDHSESAEGRALFYLDEELKCLYSTDISLLNEGEYLTPRLIDMPRDSKSREGIFTFCRDNEYYCAVIARSENGYICELHSRKAVEEMMDKSHIIAAAFPNFCSMEGALLELWQCYGDIRGDIPDEKEEKIEEMRRAMMRLTARQRKMTDITRMLSQPAEEELFELCGFCCELVDRCNDMLHGTRRIKLRSSGKIFVKMDGLNAAVALTHLIQNALKYSPIDSVPVINVFTEPNKGDPIAVIRISNIASRQLSAVDLNARQLMGTGLRIIKRFAEMEGGSFELTIQEDIISAEMTLPAVPLQKAAGKKTGHLWDILSDNGTGMPDAAETLMFEVTDEERF